MTDGYRAFALSKGEHGTVAFTDSLGTIHIRWDCGKRVGIIAEDAELVRAAPDRPGCG